MDPERIYVFSGCEEGKSEPCWPETFVNDGSPVDPCDECGAKPAEYIRADVARALYAAGQRDMLAMAANEMQLRIDYHMAKNSDAPMNYFSTARGVILALEIKDAPQ
jgi:hypothetical protein